MRKFYSANLTTTTDVSDSSSTKQPNEDKLIDFGSGGDVAITTSNDEMSTNLNNNFIDSNSSLITHNLNNNNLVAASDTNVERGSYNYIQS